MLRTLSAALLASCCLMSHARAQSFMQDTMMQDMMFDMEQQALFERLEPAFCRRS
jgi:hypothetical protein